MGKFKSIKFTLEIAKVMLNLFPSLYVFIQSVCIISKGQNYENYKEYIEINILSHWIIFSQAYTTIMSISGGCLW